jgi:hypothetical protein
MFTMPQIPPDLLALLSRGSGGDSTVRGSAHGARPTVAHQCSVPSSVSDQPKDYIESLPRAGCWCVLEK